MIRFIARVIGLTLIALALMVIATTLSQRVSGTPSGAAKELVSAALEGRAEAIQAAHAESTFVASHWYEAAVLPAIVGIVEGLIVGLFYRVRAVDSIASSFLFGCAILAISGEVLPHDLPSLLGPLLFPFALIGGAIFVRDLVSASAKKAN